MSGAPPPPPPPGFPVQGFLPPVPPPWTEHKAPNGAPYWFNPLTNVSTYTRPSLPPPTPGFPIAGAPPPPPPAGFPVAAAAPTPAAALPPLHFSSGPAAAATAAPAPQKKEKKEKPKTKVPIEGTPWIRVTTNRGNVFFSHRDTKESRWTVPDEIKEQVDELERKERDEQEREEREREEARAAAAASASAKKRKADDDEAEADGDAAADGEDAGDAAEAGEDAEGEPLSALDIEIEGGADAGAPVPDAPAKAEEEQADAPPKKKKAKKSKVVSSLDELTDEDWQRQIAAEMAADAEASTGEAVAEADAKEKERAEAEAREKEEKDKVERERLEVNQIEAAALYKVLLSEKDINPMAPFETELSKFVNDPRYHAVKNTRDRRDLFDEFCKEKIREQRAARKKAAESGVKVDPLTAYRALLTSAVTSTRTHFSDFKRAHQKDARFREYGKTEGDREKEFKRFLRDLGERKRAAAEKADREFGEMLGEDREIRPGDKWAEVKKRHASDPRYAAVVSSSLREQLFNKHLSSLASGSRPSTSAASASTSAFKASATAPSKEDRAVRAAEALREREERVRQDKLRNERSANQARGNLGREEAEREFAQLLVDAVRDHKAHFDDVAPTLARDPRFDAASLHPSDKRRLFDQHQQKLHRTRVSDVEALFAAHAPSLTTPFHDVLPAISSDAHVQRLVGSDFDALEALYASWLARRTQRAREDFTQMLRESPILEHWGRMQKLEKREKVALIGEEGQRNDESDDEADTREMAEQIDLRAIHAVLKNDKRYLEFNHVPEDRERWVEEYTKNLAAPKTTVHQRD
ncbi:uncharacterized protein JCM10292_000748 [Rhodotorula paludigena]|uniref:uncharacterized protein n=1 Tax=Rhodotorula paludigena TaxID=86838 RepID=UPI0031728133